MSFSHRFGIWRAVTALTLHSDLAHLAGNAFFGGVFGVLLAQILGGGLAWIARRNAQLKKLKMG